MNKKRVIILGCTGSIGKSTLDVCRGLGHRVEIAALSAHHNAEELVKLGAEWGVKNLAITGEDRASFKIPFQGLEGLIRMITETEADLVVNGIAGTAGFKPSLAAIDSGMNIALANKETVIMGGKLFKDYAKKKGVAILPVDSEHSALQHLLRSELREYTEELILTASGGPFRLTKKKDLENVTVDQALNHPVWKMGPKITIDSATLANKGLELMEAQILFNMPPEKLKVIIHPESHVQSLIRTIDGVLYAQVSTPNMIHPIQNAITYPKILASELKPLDLAECALTFHPVDTDKFPMLPLAYRAMDAGRSYPLVYNAANEVAVHAFLNGEIGYQGIPLSVEEILQQDWTEKVTSFDQILETDSMVRKRMTQVLAGKAIK